MLQSLVAGSRARGFTLSSKQVAGVSRQLRPLSNTASVSRESFQRNGRFATTAAVAVAAAAATLATASLSRRELPTTTPLESTAKITHRVAGVYILDASKRDFLATFPPAYVEGVDASHASVAVNPAGAKLSAIATDLGRPVQLRVTAIAKDEELEVALVEIMLMGEDDDGGVPVPFEHKRPHVVLSTAKGEKGADASRFLERLAAAAGDDLKTDFEGELPATEDGLKSSKASLMVLRHPFTLNATLCISDLWLPEDSKCGERTCGFCRFMKLGPCGKEFEAWEACIDRCKETEEDFVTKCMDQTLALKTCVDEHEDYYAAPSKRPSAPPPAEEEKSTSEP